MLFTSGNLVIEKQATGRALQRRPPIDSGAGTTLPTSFRMEISFLKENGGASTCELLFFQRPLSNNSYISVPITPVKKLRLTPSVLPVPMTPAMKCVLYAEMTDRVEAS